MFVCVTSCVQEYPCTMKIEQHKYNLRYIGVIQNPHPEIYGAYISRGLYPNTKIQSTTT
jgi:hypothetical protein